VKRSINGGIALARGLSFALWRFFRAGLVWWCGLAGHGLGSDLILAANREERLPVPGLRLPVSGFRKAKVGNKWGEAEVREPDSGGR